MGIFSAISFFKAKVKDAKTVTETRRRTQNRNRSANKFGLVSINAGPLCYSCDTYHMGGLRSCPGRQPTINEIRDLDVTDPNTYTLADEYPEDQIAPHLPPHMGLLAAELPLRPAGPWNKKLPCGHIVRDKCEHYRDS